MHVSIPFRANDIVHVVQELLGLVVETWGDVGLEFACKRLRYANPFAFVHVRDDYVQDVQSLVVLRAGRNAVAQVQNDIVNDRIYLAPFHAHVANRLGDAIELL